MIRDPNIRQGEATFHRAGWTPFPFQLEAWAAYAEGCSGLVNAPTGNGKTYSLLIPILFDIDSRKTNDGVRALWISPIRALAREIESSALRIIRQENLRVTVGIRTGDTTSKDRQKQSIKPPDILITTPESLHLMIATRNHERIFAHLDCVVADEWHELMGSKRGVQLELALSRFRAIRPSMRTWGISATISNMDEALTVLLGPNHQGQTRLIRSDLHKRIEVISILPEEPEKLPWAGHLGIRLIDKILPVLMESRSTLIFTNTRSFAEIWYQQLLERAPALAGQIAMHHGSISRDLREWVEEQLHEGKLKAVICTASLDLGVDFRPVDTVIQVGSPKGIARFLQRAGRSGHQPGATSRIYFLPTHSLELTEAAALRTGIREHAMEERIPHVRSFDVLLQYLMTLSIGDGFEPARVLEEVRQTWSYCTITESEWNWLLRFLSTGGESLSAYDEYRKLEWVDGRLKVTDRTLARRHRLSIGTIVSDTSLKVKFTTGRFLGTIEEYFIAQLTPGDVFWFAGRSLEFVRLHGTDAQVRPSKKKTGRVPSWQGGRMPLSSPLGAMIRRMISEAAAGRFEESEMSFIAPVLDLQRNRSHLPREDEFLIESFETREGHHLLMYPFEGRFVHEGLAALVAHRISTLMPITFSIAMNDYGFELLSDQAIPVEEALENDLLGTDHLTRDIQAGINATEMARRKFREIAAIAGLVFKGYPGAPVRDRHLQSSAQLFFDVFRQYDPENLLLQQAYEEVLDFQLEEARLRLALRRIARQRIVLTHPDRPSPFAFPIMVDRLREKLTSEQIQDRVRKMTLEYED